MHTFGERAPGADYVVRPAAYVVVFDAVQRVACVSETSGLFLPGGGVEAGEDALAAAHREVGEECARKLEVIAQLEPATQFFRSGDGVDFELRASFFLGAFGARLDRNAEHALSWHPSAPDPPPLYHACHRWAVERARAHAS